MRRILFVDDERSVLDGLSRLLRSMRHEWTMEFAESGAAALDVLEKSPFEVVVTDMRMPGMDGAELLAQVRDRHPQVVRMVLSGQADRDALVRAVGVTHRYLTKPCDPDLLKTAVSRACALKDLLTNQSLQEVVSSLTAIPSLPSSYIDLMRDLQSPSSSIAQVGETIARDPGLTCKLLQIVNSTFFGARRHVSSPVQAAVLLGTDLIKALALSVNVFSQFDSRIVHQFSIDRIWKHSIQAGSIARLIARAEQADAKTVEQCLTAGLLHDMGKLILVAHRPDQYGQVVALAKREGISFAAAEKEVLRTTHGEVGAFLLGLWGLPDPVVEAVAWHQHPSDCPAEGFCPLTAVHVANSLAHETETNPDLSGIPQYDAAYLERLGLADRVPAWRELVIAAAKESAP